MKTFSPDTLFHGTTVLRGNHIFLPELKTGHNLRLSHGNAFYTTPNLYAACLFSNLALQREYFSNSSLSPLEQITKAEKAGVGKIYTIQTSRTKILNARLPLPLSQAKDLLHKSNIPGYMLKSFLNREITDFYTLVQLISFSNELPKNAYEFITTEMHYDGLWLIENCWNSWDYYPEHLGLSIDKFIPSPASVLIYNTDKIRSFEEIDHSIIQQFVHNDIVVKDKKTDKGESP